MKEEKISILNEHKEKLVGIETIPSSEKEKYSKEGRNRSEHLFPSIILVHGFGVTKEEYGMFDGLAKSLSQAGFLVFRFDFSGRGESEGDYSKTSISKQKSDLEKILSFVKSHKLVDRRNIGILAQSFGTCVTVALSPEVKTIILTGSISHPNKISGMPWKWEKLDHEGISVKTKSTGEVIKIGSQFWKDFDKYDLLKTIKKITCPILFIHGSEDKRVPISEMEAYFENANEPKEKIVLEGADHGFMPHWDNVYKIAIDWFEKHLV